MNMAPARHEVMSVPKSEPHACRSVIHGEHGGAVNYYPFHLGDYASHTAHLEPMEDLAYRRMLDLYYRTEKPLPDADDVARLIRMRDFTQEVARVLTEFFQSSSEGWTHTRCEREIASFAAMVEGGRKGAAKRWGKPKHSHPIATPSTPQCHVPQWQPEPEPEPEFSVTPTVIGVHSVAKAPPKRGSRLPEGWKLPKAWGEWSLAEFPGWTAETVRLEAAKFADFWHAKAGKDAAKLDWCATWRNWCRNATPSKATLPVTVPGPEVWQPEAPLTASEMAAQAELRRKAVSAIKRVS